MPLKWSVECWTLHALNSRCFSHVAKGVGWGCGGGTFGCWCWITLFTLDCKSKILHLPMVNAVILTAGVWRASLDTGGIHTRIPCKPSGMGDVCISLLLCHDLPLAHPLRLRSPQKQQCLGCSGLYLPSDCCCVLSERLSDPSLYNNRHERIEYRDCNHVSLQVLSNRHLSSGVLAYCHIALLHPLHPFCCAVEVFLIKNSGQKEILLMIILIICK